MNSITDLMRLDERVVAVTGGASGIGLATVEAVIELGGHAAIIDISEEMVQAEVSRLTAKGAIARGYVADVTQEQSINQALDTATSDMGSLHGVVASAGIRMKSQSATDLEFAEWDRILRINLSGTFLTCRAAARILAPRKQGSIVTVASLSAHSARVNQSAYCVSKAGVVQFSRVLALELAGSGVRVNSVCPGTTVTAMFEKALEQDGERIITDRIEGALSGFRGGIPLRRLGEAIDQAAAVAYLLSDASRHVTGQSILVDGGESLT
jgi:NAD(P)-dependent dehydrogenase (short-subunit alcohol dehydrogenase family)